MGKYLEMRALRVTHWSVESQAARDLMVEKFREMKNGSRPEALRDAKLDMKNSSQPAEGTPNGNLSLSHPFFWAPFVLVGNW